MKFTSLFTAATAASVAWGHTIFCQLKTDEETYREPQFLRVLENELYSADIYTPSYLACDPHSYIRWCTLLLKACTG